jgi:hypothetical protein
MKAKAATALAAGQEVARSRTPKQHGIDTITRVHVPKDRLTAELAARIGAATSDIHRVVAQ